MPLPEFGSMESEAASVRAQVIAVDLLAELHLLAGDSRLGDLDGSLVSPTARAFLERLHQLDHDDLTVIAARTLATLHDYIVTECRRSGVPFHVKLETARGPRE